MTVRMTTKKGQFLQFPPSLFCAAPWNYGFVNSPPFKMSPFCVSLVIQLSQKHRFLAIQQDEVTRVHTLMVLRQTPSSLLLQGTVCFCPPYYVDENRETVSPNYHASTFSDSESRWIGLGVWFLWRTKVFLGVRQCTHGQGHVPYYPNSFVDNSPQMQTGCSRRRKKEGLHKLVHVAVPKKKKKRFRHPRVSLPIDVSIDVVTAERVDLRSKKHPKTYAI